jgi:DNA-binding transcriptional LysR family regulator
MTHHPAPDVEGLRTFLAIYRSGTITRAAAELFRSQPAVSRRLALLERELGAPLFERVPAGLVLTQAGEALLPFAEGVLATLQDAQAAVRAVESDEVGPVSLALVGTLAGSGLTSALREFARRHPGVELTLRTATSREVSDLVRRAEVGLGLRYSEDPAPDLRCEPLYAERLVVAAAPDHPLAGARRGAAARRLAAERWITFPDRPESATAYYRQALAAVGASDARVLRVDSLTAQKRLVEAGFGLAFLPETSVQEELAAGSLVLLDLEGLEVAVPVTLVTRRRGYLGRATRTLLEALRAAAIAGPAPAAPGAPP